MVLTRSSKTWVVKLIKESHKQVTSFQMFRLSSSGNTLGDAVVPCSMSEECCVVHASMHGQTVLSLVWLACVEYLT